MALILSGIFSLAQHLRTSQRNPEAYRPETCPCGHTRFWCHGCYSRKADRQDLGQPCLDVRIPRFYCPECRHTCSVLPECIPPRSWYLWEVRQVIFLLLLAGTSLGRAHVLNGSRACRKTIKRWWRRFHDCFPLYSFHLRLRFPCLGRHTGFADFWKTLLGLRPLSSAMCLLHLEGVTVP